MRGRFNAHLHSLYVRQDFESCLRCIESVLSECKGMSEYPVYVKALIKRQRGEIQESMQLFQAATCLNPQNVCNLKQVGRSLYLLGKHKAALDVYAEAQRLGIDDWEIWHNKGLCNMYLKQYEMAADCFRRANAVQRHDTTYMQLGKVFTLQEDYRGAIDVYLEALEFSPENPELLTTLGLIYLRLGENYKAFDFLGNSLTHDPKNPKTILAAGSIIQVRCSAACRKSAHAAHAARARARARRTTRTWMLRSSSTASPLCRRPTRHNFGTTLGCASSASSGASPAAERGVASPISCAARRGAQIRSGDCLSEAGALPRPIRVDHLVQPRPGAPEHGPVCLVVPLLLHFHQPQAGLCVPPAKRARRAACPSPPPSIRPGRRARSAGAVPSSYMYLAITLNRLDDFENACSAYEKAIDMEADHLFELNYAITLYNNNELARVRTRPARARASGNACRPARATVTWRAAWTPGTSARRGVREAFCPSGRGGAQGRSRGAGTTPGAHGGTRRGGAHPMTSGRPC